MAVVELPKSIIKKVNRKNWRKLYNEGMLAENADGKMDYIWTPKTMEKFIENLVNAIDKEGGLTSD